MSCPIILLKISQNEKTAVVYTYICCPYIDKIIRHMVEVAVMPEPGGGQGVTGPPNIWLIG